MPRGMAAISRQARHEPDWNDTAMRVREQCSGPVFAISISPYDGLTPGFTIGSATADVRSRRANLIQLQNLSPEQKRAKCRSRSNVVPKTRFEFNLANTSRIDRFIRRDAIQFASLSLASALSALPLSARSSFACRSGRSEEGCRPFRATESRSHLPMSAAPFLFSDRTQRNVRARFQDTRRLPPGNFLLTFDKDLRRERDIRATRIFYRRNGNALMSRQESWGVAG